MIDASSGAPDQMAAIRAMLQQAGAPPTAENYNRASLHMAQTGGTGPMLFDQAMERAVAQPTPRQARQAVAQAPLRNSDPSGADGSAYPTASVGGTPAPTTAPMGSAPPMVVVPNEVQAPQETVGSVVDDMTGGTAVSSAVATPPVGEALSPEQQAAAPAWARQAAAVGTAGLVGFALQRLGRRAGIGAADALRNAPTPAPTVTGARVQGSTVGTPDPMGPSEALRAQLANNPAAPRGNTRIEQAGPPASMMGSPTTQAAPAVPVPTASMVPAPMQTPTPNIAVLPAPGTGTGVVSAGGRPDRATTVLPPPGSQPATPPMQTSRNSAATSEQKPAPVSRPRRNANPRIRENDTAPSVDPVVTQVARRKRRAGGSQ